MDKKYQVFISSTYADLVEERQKAMSVLLMADCIPAGMEAFVATDDEQFNVIKKVIDLCDYYILIIGKRYGSVNLSSGLSYTEMEYDYAKSINVPILVFALDDSVSLPPEKNEVEPEKANQLKLFKDKAMSNRLASIWKTSGDLVGMISIAIMRAKDEIVRPGWQRAVDYDEASLRREIMELQKQRDELQFEIQKASEEIEAYKTQDNIAFDDYKIVIKYYYYVRYPLVREDKGVSVYLTDLFSVIATEMMDVSLTELAVSKAIKTYLDSWNDIHFSDDQLVKRLLNQFRTLGFLWSHWDKDNKNLFWGLTAKGKKVRDDKILLRNTEAK